jgi:PAT family beta-lactamase induction signal transducer AmpG
MMRTNGNIMVASRRLRLFLIFVLGMTEYMPLTFQAAAVPVLYRRAGASMRDMGFLSLVMIPWALKALWAPVVDRIGAHSRFGRYRGWLFCTHPLLMLTLIGGAFTDLPALLMTSRGVGLLALLWLSIVSATADTASHGLAVNMLDIEERSLGSGALTVGMATGSLIGGGLMIMLVDKLGWRIPILLMAGCVMVPLIGIAMYREPPTSPAQTLSLREVLRWFALPRIGRWILVLALLSLFTALPAVPFQALFVDHGLSLSEIGMLVGIIGALVGIAAGILGGLAVRTLERRWSFYVLHILCGLCMAGGSFIITRASPSHPMLYASMALLNFGVGLGTTVLRVMLMDRCRSHLASTDFTIQTCTMGLFSFLGYGVSGILASRFGVKSVLTAAPLCVFVLLISVPRLLARSDFEQSLTKPHSPNK